MSAQEAERILTGPFSQHPDFVRLLLREKLLKKENIAVPYFKLAEGMAGRILLIDQKECVNFCSSNYLNLTSHPAVLQAAKAAIDEHGTSISASRLVGGERPILNQLESKISELLQVEAALTFISGYTANVATISTLFGEKDLIIYDQLCHNSIIQGAKLSGAVTRSFHHNDMAALSKLLQDHRAKHERILIVVEGLYSMDGDLPPMMELIQLKEQFNALLMVDEAHSVGVLGETGGGVRAHFGLPANKIDIYMGALSKSLAGCGGYIAGELALILLLKYQAPGFIFSVGLAPAFAAASLKAIEIMQHEPDHLCKLRKNCQLFLSLAKDAQLNTGCSEGHAIVPILVGNDLSALKLAEKLLEQGIYVQAMIYPAVRRAQARLRFFINASHTEQDLVDCIRLVRACYR